MTVSLKIEDAVGIVVIDRQSKLNALDLQCFREIDSIVERVRDDRGIRSLIFTAAGDRAFSAGADINDLSGLTAEEASERATFRRFALQRLAECAVPTIALVEGFAMGGGVELAMACNFRMATEKATFSFPEINLGLLPGAGATQRLPRLIGEARALEMMLTARKVGAREALEIGLINRIVTNPLAEAIEFARQWERFSRTAVTGIMAATRFSELPIHDGLAKEGEELARLNTSPDGIEGVAAFLEKRAPLFNRD